MALTVDPGAGPLTYGKVQATRRPIVGAKTVAGFLIAVQRQAPASMNHRITDVNGQPSLLPLARAARVPQGIESPRQAPGWLIDSGISQPSAESGWRPSDCPPMFSGVAGASAGWEGRKVSWSLVFETLRFEMVSNFLRYFFVAAPFFVVFWVWEP